MWQEFAKWCRTRGLRALPAHPWTVAAYVRWCESRHRSGTIIERIRSIARVHVLACVPSPDRHPIVGRTLAQLTLRERTLPNRADLFEADAGKRASAPLPPADDTAEASETAEEPARHRRRRTLRATPPLVQRRPKRG